jgi:methyl-accepting chemotaxis protein
MNMQSPALGPFLGSMPSPDLGGARLARQLDAVCSCLAILAGASIWVGAWLTGPNLDIARLLWVSSAVMLGAALIGTWLVNRAAGWERLGIALILGAVEERLFQHRTSRAVRLAPAETQAPGIAGLIEGLVYRVQRWKTPGSGSPEQGAAITAALRHANAEAQVIVSSLYMDADVLAETAGEMAAGLQGIASAGQQADQACGAAEASISQVIDRVTQLTAAVGATTAEVRRVSASALALSDRAFAAQRSVAGLDDHTAKLVVTIERMEDALKRMGNLGQSAAIEAARSGDAAQAFAPIVSGIQELTRGTLAALGSLQRELGAMSGQAAEASLLAQDICEKVKAHHELGLGLSYAVRQQGEEIAGILQALDESRSGFVTLRASVEAVTRGGSARLAGSEALREAAARLPSHADAMVRLLRDLPDCVPSQGFDF